MSGFSKFFGQNVHFPFKNIWRSGWIIDNYSKSSKKKRHPISDASPSSLTFTFNFQFSTFNFQFSSVTVRDFLTARLCTDSEPESAAVIDHEAVVGRHIQSRERGTVGIMAGWVDGIASTIHFGREGYIA